MKRIHSRAFCLLPVLAALAISVPAADPGIPLIYNLYTPSVSDPSQQAANPSAGVATLEPVPPLPAEYAELISQADASGATMYKRLLEYTYQLKKIHRVLNDRGNSVHTQEQVFEAYPIRGEHVLVTLSRDGILSRTISDERKRAAKQLLEAERERAGGKFAEGSVEGEGGGYVSAGVTGIYQGKSGYVSIDVSKILRSCEFFSPRLETIDGREMVVLNYRPRPGERFAANYAYIAGLVGTVWIDRNDKVLARLEGWPASTFDLAPSTAPRDEAALIYQQVRETDGVWFPSIIRMNAGGRGALFDGLNWDVLFEFSNYQRFNITANDKLNVPPAQTP